MRRTVIASLLFTALSFAANLTGTWKAVGPGTSSANIILKQSGDKLTGTYLGPLGRGDVTGTIKDDSVEWSFSNGEGKVTYTGSIKDVKKIEGAIIYSIHPKMKFVAQKISDSTDEKKVAKDTKPVLGDPGPESKTSK